MEVVDNYGALVYTPIYMPPYLAWIDPWQGEVDSSSLLASTSVERKLEIMKDPRLGAFGGIGLILVLFLYLVLIILDFHHRQPQPLSFLGFRSLGLFAVLN